MTLNIRWFMLAAAVLSTLSAGVARAEKPIVGQAAPKFEVTTFDGRKLSLADLKGKVVILNFWATWCPPCRVELPLLDAYYRAQQKFGLEVVAVTTEDSAPFYKLKPLAQKVSITMARWFKGSAYPEAKKLPTNYVIDRNGVLRYAEPGAFTLDGLNTLLVPLLQEEGPPQAPAAAEGAPSASHS